MTSVKMSIQEIKNRIAISDIFEEIEVGNNRWIILDKDEKTGRAELLGRSCIAEIPYDGKKNRKQNWKRSAVRSWLRREYAKSLPKELRRMITRVKKEDRETVYLLSSNEYEDYETRCGGILYRYGINGTYDCNWWLRDRTGDKEAKYVSYIRGGIDSANAEQGLGVRPALTVKYK